MGEKIELIKDLYMYGAKHKKLWQETNILWYIKLLYLLKYFVLNTGNVYLLDLINYYNDRDSSLWRKTGRLLCVVVMCRRCYVSCIALDVIIALFTVFSCVCGNVIAVKINTGYLYIRISLAATKFAPLTYIMLLLHLAANNAALSAAIQGEQQRPRCYVTPRHVTSHHITLHHVTLHYIIGYCPRSWL